MTCEVPVKRKRGAQPGNHNAKNNRGNKTTRRHRFARGNRLGGAPLGNQNARKKRPAAHIVLLKQFERDREAAEWIKAHASELDAAGFKDDNQRDRALLDGYLGLTPELLAERGAEFRLGLYSVIEHEIDDSQPPEPEAFNDARAA